MKTQYLRYQKRWTAFMTLNGVDIQEYGNTEQEAQENLANRIKNSTFLMQGIKVSV